MSYVDNRQQNVSVFEDTCAWYTQDAIRKGAIRLSRYSIKFYTFDSVSPDPEMLARFSKGVHILVSPEFTLQTAGKYARQKITVLNLASQPEQRCAPQQLSLGEGAVGAALCPRTFREIISGKATTRSTRVGTM